ncbi:SDR family NAD(P)-dependent oxidoreductase [Saccharothrix australiensis]|uniref:Short-subunit dehydrogenase n=1 Tax=Saccharothrix australiensis TaxID=2072 RepID=A0A495W3V4_9PSEU|nr:SDR family NAD(P)-dependent oxidoreductase [Saccharothrix australiensis]RKT55445.1 short-subunit dehydrogenase [Saccharothrix australiensis]
MLKYRFTGGTAVVTGAAGALGEQLAHGLAARGSDLVLLDRDAARLDEVARAIRDRFPESDVEPRVVDLADLPGLAALADSVVAAHPRISLLVNSAGVAAGGTFERVTADEFDRVVAVAFLAPVTLTRLLLPRLLRTPASHVVNVSGLFGLVAPAGRTAHAAGEFALRGFSESLRHELADRGIGVTTVHASGIRADARATGEPARASRFAKLIGYPADRAAQQVLRAVEYRKPRVLIAFPAHAADLLGRLAPRAGPAVLSRLQPDEHRDDATTG